MNVTRYTTTELVKQVKRIESIPTSQATFTDTDLVELMNMELQSVIVPLIVEQREEYFVHVEDFTVGPDNNEVEIPDESTGLRLREVFFVDGSDNLARVHRVWPEQIAGDTFFTTWGARSGFDVGFYIQNSKLIFYPKLSSTRTCRLMYFQRPGHLVLSNQGGKVIAKNALANIITLDNAPTSWDTTTVLDVFKPEVPFNYRVRDVSVVGKSGFDIEVSPTDFANINIGDYVAEYSFSQFVQFMPVEAYHLLVQGTGMRCLEALGDRPGWANAQAKFEMMKRDLVNLLNPRIEGEPKKVINLNSILRAGRFRIGNWY